MSNSPPDRLIINGLYVRSAYEYPGGPMVGHVVTHRGRVIVLVKVGQGLDRLNATLAAAVRFAQGCPTLRDTECAVGRSTCQPFPEQPAWYAVVRGVPVIGRYRRRGYRIVFHRHTGLPSRDAGTSPAAIRAFASRAA